MAYLGIFRKQLNDNQRIRSEQQAGDREHLEQ